MSRPRPHPMAHNRTVYQTITDRIDYLQSLGPSSAQIINDLRKTDIIRRPIKGMNPYRLEEHVIICSDRVFRAEKRIIREARPEEWEDDSRLQCISKVLVMRDVARDYGFEIDMKPNHFSLKLHHIKIDAEYDEEQIIECTQLLSAYSKATIKHDGDQSAGCAQCKDDPLAESVQRLKDPGKP